MAIDADIGSLETPWLLASRFRVGRSLGRGGMGVVYEAVDEETGARVALKMLRRMNAESLYLFKQEFRQLADIQHPNLVRLGELLGEGDQWFFTMELVEGERWQEHVRPPPPLGGEPSASPAHGVLPIPADTTATTMTVEVQGAASGLRVSSRPPDAKAAFDETRLRAALGQLASGLVALHKAGRVHRDIKPSNIMVTTEGRVVLLDFGLVGVAQAGARARSAKAGAAQGSSPQMPAVCGTPAYMAPEQAERRDVGPAADWYAFGALLHQALTGVVPFQGSPVEMLDAKRRLDPTAPSSLVAGVPPDLDALCLRLLARDPAARPGGAEVLRALGAGDPVPGGLAAGGAADDPTDTVDLAPPFVGRASELARLAEALRASRGPSAVAVLVHGEPGMGKSALVRTFLERARRETPSLVVLRGRAYEQESVPFKAFDTVIDSLSEHLSRLSDAEASKLVAEGVRYLAATFPVLRRVGVIGRSLVDGLAGANPFTVRWQAFQELKKLLARVADASPLVVFLDDLQWADRDSIALLNELLAPPSPRCLLIATMRSRGAAAPDLGDVGGQRLAPRFDAIPVGSLSRIEAASLLTGLGVSPAVHTAAAGPTLFDEAGGHPLFLTELSRFVAEDDPTRNADEPRQVRLEDVLRRRVRGLPSAARRLLRYCALAGVPVAYPVLVRAAALEGSEALGALAQLRASQLVRMTRRGRLRLMEPYHDRVREAVLEEIAAGADPDEPSVQAEHMHQRLGRALLQSAASKDANDALVFAVVRHLNAAAHLEVDPDRRCELAELNLRAGRKAQTATAFDVALGYFEKGLELLPDDAWTRRYELARDLGAARVEALYLTGDAGAALTSFRTLLPKLATDEERADVYVVKVELDTAQRRFAEAIASIREALAMFHVRLPRVATTFAILREYVALLLRWGRRDPASIAELPAATSRAVFAAIKLLVALAPPTYFADTNLLAITMMRMVRLSLRFGVTDLSAYGVCGYGLVLSGAFGKHALGDRLGEAAVRLNARFDRRDLEARIYFIKGATLTPWMRPFREARAELLHGWEMGRLHGDAAYEAYNAGTVATLTMCEGGPLATAAAVLERCVRITERRRDVDMAALAEAQLRFCEALQRDSDGEPDLSRAGSSDAELEASLSDQATPIGRFFYFSLHAALAYLFAKDLKRALEDSDAAEARLQGQFGIPGQVPHRLFRALLSARALEHARGIARLRHVWRLRACLRDLRRWAASCPTNYRAAYLLAFGEARRIRGDTAGARAAFREAHASALSSGHLGHAALALELEAALARLEGDGAAARRAQDAVDAYVRWGAFAKARHLARAWGLAPPPEAPSVGPASAGPASAGALGVPPHFV